MQWKDKSVWVQTNFEICANTKALQEVHEKCTIWKTMQGFQKLLHKNELVLSFHFPMNFFEVPSAWPILFSCYLSKSHRTPQTPPPSIDALNYKSPPPHSETRTVGILENLPRQLWCATLIKNHWIQTDGLWLLTANPIWLGPQLGGQKADGPGLALIRAAPKRGWISCGFSRVFQRTKAHEFQKRSPNTRAVGTLSPAPSAWKVERMSYEGSDEPGGGSGETVVNKWGRLGQIPGQRLWRSRPLLFPLL